jgi:hypothetical protein
MDLRIKATATYVAAALTLVLATPAYGAPAGDEYLPKVPKASGESERRDGNSGGSSEARGGEASSGEASSSSDTATTESETLGAAPAGGGGGDSGKGEGAQPKKDAKDADPAPVPISSAPASSSDDSSDSALFSPVAILLIAGVLIAVVGMTLRRRNTDGDQQQEGAGTGRPERGKAPPTPDGEIIAGGDRPS